MNTRYSESLARKNANSYRGEGRYWFERNDCSVIAFAYAFDIPYLRAHGMCAEAGRKDCHGFSLHHVLKVSVHKKSKQLLGRRVGYHGRPKMTVGRFQKKHPEGIYIIRVGRHIFTMIDGKCFNQTNMKSVVSYYYYISKSKNNDSTSGQQEMDNANPICSEEKSIEVCSQQMDNPQQNSGQVY